MRLSAYASRVHFWRHLQPVIAALRSRGVTVDVWAEGHEPWGPAVTHATRDQVAPVVLLASPADADRWRDRSVIFAEHGAGQTYTLAGSNLRPQDIRFAGSPGLDQVALFLCPSQRIADRWRTAYPQAEAVAVGCPALDRYVGSAGRLQPRQREGSDAREGDRPLVAITSHWHMGGNELPEGMPALPHHTWALPEIADQYEVVGHAHPRDVMRAKRFWTEHGIPFEPDPDVILSTADLLIADSTSLLYEAAAVGLPSVVLNCPAYRRDVHHGLRFWDAIPGIQCDEPADLPHAVEVALADAPPWPEVRNRAARAAYSFLDGRASERAADAIIALLESHA